MWYVPLVEERIGGGRLDEALCYGIDWLGPSHGRRVAHASRRPIPKYTPVARYHPLSHPMPIRNTYPGRHGRGARLFCWAGPTGNRPPARRPIKRGSRAAVAAGAAVCDPSSLSPLLGLEGATARTPSEKARTRDESEWMLLARPLCVCRYLGRKQVQATVLDSIRLRQAQKGLDRVERAQRAVALAWMPASTDCLKGEDASS